MYKFVKSIFDDGIIGLFLPNVNYRNLFYSIGYVFGREIGWACMIIVTFVNYVLFPFS